jgi:hypothetical protein
VATAGDERTPASNDGFAFGVSALVIGQRDATVHEGLRLGLALPNDLAFVGSRLIVADQNNNRVLIWNTPPTANHQQADLVLGQPGFDTGGPNHGGVGPANFRGSNGVASDGTRLVVSDRYNHRVLIWNTFPTENFQPADVVVGQPDFATTTANTGGVSARSMTEPWAWLCSGKLVVADRVNARVLIWNAIPTQNNAAADVVLGQPDMTMTMQNNGGLSASSLWDPGRGTCDGTRLFVPDLANHRVLIWNSVPTVNNTPANRVLGQTTLTTNAPNAGGAVGAVGLNSPIAVFAQGDTVAVADYLNHRVLLWTTAIAADGQAANVVIGQPDATSNTINAGGDVNATGMANPNAVAGDGTRLAISDRFNNRVLIYSTLPSAHGAAASLVLGQPDFVSNALSNGGPVSGATFASPMAIARVGDGMALADSAHARVLIWDALPAAPDDLPQRVLGQPDFTSGGLYGGMTSALSLCGPWHVHSDGTRLLVGEQCGRRVAIWSALPAMTHEPIDLALGQPDLTSAVINNGGVSASSLSGRPAGHVAGGRVFVADPNNNRVLIWNEVPTATGEAADVVLGQPDMASTTANNGGLGAQTLYGPEIAYTVGERLLVVDTVNHRVLIWNAIPSANQTPADLVIGQPNMTTGTPSAPSASRLSSPRSVHVDAGGRLYVVDNGNHRIVYWNALPTANGAPADGVIGQPNLDSGLANNGGIGAETLQSPSGLLAVGDLLYISDSGNDRLLVRPRP